MAINKSCKKQRDMNEEQLLELEAKALELTKANVQKGRSARTGSYLGRFVSILKGDEDNARTRIQIIAKMSVDICQEQFEADGGMDFENPEHLEAFADINKKCKAQVAAAISDSQNNTSLSFNPTTKDKYELNRGTSAEGETYWITEVEAE